MSALCLHPKTYRWPSDSNPLRVPHRTSNHCHHSQPHRLACFLLERGSDCRVGGAYNAPKESKTTVEGNPKMRFRGKCHAVLSKNTLPTTKALSSVFPLPSPYRLGQTFPLSLSPPLLFLNTTTCIQHFQQRETNQHYQHHRSIAHSLALKRKERSSKAHSKANASHLGLSGARKVDHFIGPTR